MKKVRTIRIDKEVSDNLDSICNRHGDVSWHIEQALNGYGPIKGLTVKPTESKGISPTPIKGGWVEGERLFERFWVSGMKKVNKKKASSLFFALIKKATPTYEEAFTDRLINDVKTRIASNQLGFAEMHPTTYLNGERWTDEVTPNGQNQSGRPTTTGRLTPAQRTRAAAERWEADQTSNVPPMGGHAGDIRPPVEQPVRGGADEFMGTTLEGDYTRSD